MDDLRQQLARERAWHLIRENLRPMPSGPVILVHLEDPDGSGLSACTGYPFEQPPSAYPDIPRVLCTGCHLVARGR